VHVRAPPNSNPEVARARPVAQIRKNETARIVGNWCFLSRNGVQIPTQRIIYRATDWERRVMMNNEFRGSAKIYQFPIRPRARAPGQLGQATRDATLRSPEVSNAVDGAWYHQAAIQEAKRAGER
jgi:hypothetical protein